MKTKVGSTLPYGLQLADCFNFYRLPEQGSFITQKSVHMLPHPVTAAVFMSTIKDTLCIITCRTNVQIFGNDVNKSKVYSGRKQEQIEVRECLLPLGAEPFVFQFAIQKFKDHDI